MNYQCRGRVQSIKHEGGALSFRFKAKAQFVCSENEIPRAEKFNILLPFPKTPPIPIAPINSDCLAIATVVEITANDNFSRLLTASRDEDATIVVEYNPRKPKVCKLFSIRVGRDDG